MPSVPETREPRPASSGASSPASTLPPAPNKLILLAEQQWLFLETDLLSTPSVAAGLSPTAERENRAKGVNFILQVGMLLKLPQTTLATAAVYLHRFFMRAALQDAAVTGAREQWHHYSVAAACLFLATKVEENCRKMRDLVVACVRVAQKAPAKEVDEQDKEFWRWRDTILGLEDRLLEALCFDLALDSPYTALFAWLVRFGLATDKALRNAAWAFLNDSFLTPACLLFASRTLAAAAIYCAARFVGAAIPDGPHATPWWTVMGVELRQIRQALNFITAEYEHPPLKGAAAEPAMYQRTPEDGDEARAKTRQRQEGAEINYDGAGSQRNGSRRLSSDSMGSGGSRKRGRPADDEGMQESGEYARESTWGGEARGDSEGAKRPKVEPGTYNDDAGEPTRQAARRGEDRDEYPSDKPKQDSRTNGVDAAVNGVQVEDSGGGLINPKMEEASEEGELEQ